MPKTTRDKVRYTKAELEEGLANLETELEELFDRMDDGENVQEMIDDLKYDIKKTKRAIRSA